MKLINKLFFILLILGSQGVSAVDNMSKKEFISLAFPPSSKPVAKTLWLDKKLQASIRLILNHNYPKLRLRYKQTKSDQQFQTVWFLDEIGKDQKWLADELEVSKAAVSRWANGISLPRENLQPTLFGLLQKPYLTITDIPYKTLDDFVGALP